MGITRKIKRNENKEKMLSTSSEYIWSFDCDGDNQYKVFVKKINPQIFIVPGQLNVAYELFFRDLIDEAKIKGHKIDILEFLRDSVKNNYTLRDSLTKQKFKVIDNCIITKIDNEGKGLINTGEFIIENYKINTCYSYMFLTDLNTNEQYMYYGD